MNKKRIITITTILVAIFLSVLFIPRLSQPKLTYETMTAGQLLDVQLWLEKKINALVLQKKEVQQLRDSKTASLRGQDGKLEVENSWVVQGAKSILQKDLGLR